MAREVFFGVLVSRSAFLHDPGVGAKPCFERQLRQCRAKDGSEKISCHIISWFVMFWPQAAAPHLQKGWGRTHIVNSSRSGTFKRPGAGVAIRAPATQTMPPVAGEG